MKPKIVVPTDFSESSLKGLDFAVQLAKKVGAKIMLHHIIEGFQDTRMYGNAQPSPEEKMMMNLMDIAAHKKMAEVTAQYQDTGVEIEMFVSVGTVYASVEEKIAGDDVDLIVVGTRGHSKLDKKHLGSNSHKIIRNSKHPVIVVEGDVKLDNIKHIVFASEFGEEPEKVIRELNDWQEITGAKITLLKVNHPNFTMSHKDIEEALKDFAVHNHIKNYEIAIYTDIDPAHGIIHFAEKEGAGLIFVGTDFYRGLWERLWHRRTQVAEEVATHTGIPVISYQPN
ncbi:universal stress protein [Raineya sp.]|jgi:nucleotide-binding universal stress UspA family protein